MGTFTDLAEYLALPRTNALAVSPDGKRLVAAVSELTKEGAEFAGTLWEIDPTGAEPARRLTDPARPASSPAFDGDTLVFVREHGDGDDATSAIWELPVTGEPVLRAQAPGGLSSPVARGGVVLAVGPRFAADDDADARIRTARKAGKVSAILHSAAVVRYWDTDLGPALPWLYRIDDDGAKPLTPLPFGGFSEPHPSLSPDGSFTIIEDGAARGTAVRARLVRVDTRTGDALPIVDDEAFEAHTPAISPDGRRVAYVREAISTPEQAPTMTLWVHDLATGEDAQWAAQWDRWPGAPVWTPDGEAVLLAADDDGRAPVFRVEAAGATRLTDDAGAYSSLQIADGGTAFALRSSYLAPPHPVRLDGGTVVDLPPVAAAPDLPGTLTELTSTGPDGARTRSWLALPDGADAEHPAPLLLWVHGGPLGSWNAWQWRWNPWLLAARGYAVLLPDPALSTGYGQELVQRGWGRWGGPVFTDLMAAVDAAEVREDIDETRTAAMGGSFGGYMANWIAGHTDRFDAVVSHAGLWELPGFGTTTDAPFYWRTEMTPAMAEANSPHHAVADIRTPMLVIHGDKDYRVPISEALSLWTQLLAESGLPAAPDGSTEHRFLYFPDENHWIRKPGNVAVWYETVIAFLAEHVLAESRDMPEVLASGPGISAHDDVESLLT